MLARITLNTDTFYAVLVTNFSKIWKNLHIGFIRRSEFKNSIKWDGILFAKH